MQREATALPGNIGLLLVGDDFLFEKRQKAVGDYLGMYSQVFLVLEVFQNSVGELSEPYLKGGPVVDQLGNVMTDPLGNIIVCNFWACTSDDRLFMNDQVIDLIDVNETVAPRPWHPGIDLGDDQSGILHSGAGYVHGDA